MFINMQKGGTGCCSLHRQLSKGSQYKPKLSFKEFTYKT